MKAHADPRADPRRDPGPEATCDLRSDTLTRPSPAMRAAMAGAEVGDDVYGEDPTVRRLEAACAERLGKPAALFLPTGTMSNLAAVLAHCGRGDELVIGARYHVAVYEASGASVLGGVSIRTVPVAPDGAIEPADVTAAVNADDAHFAVSRLLSLENTHDGLAVPIARLAAATEAARAAGLGAHLDGARLFNAALALGVEVAEVAAPFDTVSLCLSKGLGAPAGSVLAGEAALVSRARRLRKMLGGGMRQSGVLAAAGLVALDAGAARLGEDHARAERLGAALEALAIGSVSVRTNMVFWTPREGLAEPAARLAAMGVLIGAPRPAARMVLHADVTDPALDRAVEAFGRLAA